MKCSSRSKKLRFGNISSSSNIDSNFAMKINNFVLSSQWIKLARYFGLLSIGWNFSHLSFNEYYSYHSNSTLKPSDISYHRSPDDGRLISPGIANINNFVLKINQQNCSASIFHHPCDGLRKAWKELKTQFEDLL